MPSRTSLISLSHPLLIASAPAFGYLVAYLDRLGEALAYGVPTDYVFVSITDALARTSLVVVVAALFLLGIRLRIRLRSVIPHWAENALEVGSSAFLVAACALILTFNPPVAGFFFFAGLLSIILALGWGFLRRKKSQSPTARPIASGAPNVDESKRATESFELPIWFLTFLVLSMLGLAFIGGNLRASNRTRYLAVKDEPLTLLLTLYGDNRAVLGVLKPNTRELTAERRLVSVPGSLSDYVWTETGIITWPEGKKLMPFEDLFSIGRKK